MNYVIAAWLSCGAILLAYALRTLHRERSLRRSLAPSDAGPSRAIAKRGRAQTPAESRDADRALAPEGSRTWT
jgi:hypothetical protein